MGVTFDTNVLLSAMLWDGSVSQKLLFDLIRQNVEIYSTVEILLEYKKVLKRDFDFSDEEVKEIIEKNKSFLTIIIPDEKIDIVSEDADDNKIVECAVASASKYIITYDSHLLKIIGYKGIRIIKPEEARAIF